MANLSGGLGAAAVLTMGEGDEQTPLCLIEDVSFVEFQPRDPNADELAELKIPLEDDLFAPFLQNVPWENGARRHK
jgi:F420-0:gamma-glutamyl ligase